MTAPSAPPPLDELLARREWVRRFARTLARDDASADDLAQDAWVAAVEHPPRHADAPAGWFRRVLTRRAMNRARGERRRGAHETAASRPDVSPSTADVVAAAESHRRVVEAVMGLDEPYRATVLLRFFEDLPPREVAARMNVPVETVRSRVRRAVEMLRARLDEEHDGKRAAWLAPLLGNGREAPTPTHVGPLAKGVIAMTTAKKVAAIAAVLLFLAGGAIVWRLEARDDRSRESAAAAPSRGSPQVGTRPSTKPRRSAAGESSASTDADTKSESGPATTPPTEAPPAAPVETLVVKVVDTDGRPVAGADVEAVDRDGVKSSVHNATTDHHATTDGNGSAQFRASSPFMFASVSSRPDGAEALVTESSTASTTPARRNRVPVGCREFTLVVRRCSWITGIVVGSDGKPLAQATVQTVEGGRVRGMWTSAENGEFKFAAATPGPFDLMADWRPPSNRGASATADGDFVGEALDVAAGRRDIVIALKPVAAKKTLRLRAVTSAGTPLARVTFVATMPSQWTLVGTATTDAEGRATIADAPCRPLYIRVATDYPKNPEWARDGWITPQDRIVRPTDDEIAFVFAAGRPVRGRVIAPEDSGVAVWQVIVVGGSDRVSTTSSDSAGLFEILVPADAPGPFRLTTGVRDTRSNRTFEGESGEVRAGDQGVELHVNEVK